VCLGALIAAPQILERALCLVIAKYIQTKGARHWPPGHARPSARFYFQLKPGLSGLAVCPYP
jgi:hypothetical protein